MQDLWVSTYTLWVDSTNGCFASKVMHPSKTFASHCQTDLRKSCRLLQFTLSTAVSKECPFSFPFAVLFLSVNLMKCLVVWIYISLIVTEHFFCIVIGHLFFNESLTHCWLTESSFSSEMPHLSKIKFLLMLGAFLDFLFCYIDQSTNSFSSCSLTFFPGYFF